MVKVPIWEQDVGDLPGASKTPFATPEAFGSEIGVAQEKAGRAIESGLTKLGDALTEQYNEQEAIKGKAVLSDYETAFTKFRADLDRNTDPSQAYTKPDKIKAWQDENWPKYRQGVSGKYQQQADGTVHVFNNKINVDAAIQGQADKDKYVELQIDSTAEKQSGALMANPGQLEAAAGVIRSQVEETDLAQKNPFEGRRMKLKYANQMYDAVMKGYTDRVDAEPANTALRQEVEDFKKNGTRQIAKALNIQELPPTTPGPPAGPVNQKRVQQIDSTPSGPVIAATAAQVGVDPERMKVKASIESSGNPRAQTGKYKGLFQLSDAEFVKWGPAGGNIFDAHDNAFAAARKTLAEGASFTKANGRPPTLTEEYMMHQQGVGGAAAHYAHPDAPAWQNMLSTGEGREKGEAWAKKAIWGNVPDKMKARFGSVENISSRDFIHMWDQKVTGGSGGDITAFKGPVRPDHLAEADKAMGLNAQERELYRTHLKNLYGPGGVDNAPTAENPSGSRSTLFVMTAGFDGKTYLIPTVKDGKILSKDDAVAEAKKNGLENYPSYKTLQEAKFRYAEMHTYMDKDTGEYFDAKNGRHQMTQPPNSVVRMPPPGEQQPRPIVIHSDSGGHVVVPTVSSEGGFKVLSDSAAAAQFKNTGQHIGIFDTATGANAQAESVAKGGDIRGETPRSGTLSDTSPLLGNVPKEMTARQDHWDAKLKALDEQNASRMTKAKAAIKEDFGQEEGATKAHGEAGINARWNFNNIGMVLGAREADYYSDFRAANLKYHAYTRWNDATPVAQMQADLAQLDPVNVNPQSPAFTQYVKNFKEAAEPCCTRWKEANDKRTKKLGEEKMKTITDVAYSGKDVTDDMITAAKPWLSDHQLTTAYTLRDKPPLQPDAGALIRLEQDSRTAATGGLRQDVAERGAPAATSTPPRPPNWPRRNNDQLSMQGAKPPGSSQCATTSTAS